MLKQVLPRLVLVGSQRCALATDKLRAVRLLLPLEQVMDQALWPAFEPIHRAVPGM